MHITTNTYQYFPIWYPHYHFLMPIHIHIICMGDLMNRHGHSIGRSSPNPTSRLGSLFPNPNASSRAVAAHGSWYVVHDSICGCC